MQVQRRQSQAALSLKEGLDVAVQAGLQSMGAAIALVVGKMMSLMLALFGNQAGTAAQAAAIAGQPFAYFFYTHNFMPALGEWDRAHVFYNNILT